MEKIFETYGIDLKNVAEEAKANGKEDVAKAIEEKIADFQKIYDFFSSRITSCPDEPIWNVDAEELKKDYFELAKISEEIVKEMGV